MPRSRTLGLQDTALRIAIVHDWLTGMRGGEYVLEAIAQLFPGADLFTLVHARGSVSPFLEGLPIRTSWLQRLPGAVDRYRYFLPVFPEAARGLDVSGYDLVLSSSHCAAKGVRKAAGAVHVSYVHAPMRYVWDRFEDYFGPGRASLPVRIAARAVRGRLQRWDRAVSAPERVDLLIANSRFTAQRIRELYGRKATVVHPFVDPARFDAPRRPEEFYLMVGAFAPNKRVDLAIEAFNDLGLPLWIVGSGQEEERLRAMAGSSVRFLGTLGNAEIAGLYARCRAFVFPGVEDFGITPLEAMAAGVPVVAYGQGGALETVTEQTGVFFEPQDVSALAAVIRRIEREDTGFSEEAARTRSREFTRERFQSEYLAAVREAWVGAGKDTAAFLCR